jgi:hypothetical protein
MKITLEVTITGLEGWSVDWSDTEGVKMELSNLEAEGKFKLADGLGLGHRNVEVEATLDRSGN